MGTTSYKVIFKNSAFLYARMAIVMVINLYVVRLVLNTLGVVDYGIYDVVAGIVVMFNSVSNVLSMSTQRFFSYAIGDSKKYRVDQVFSSSVLVFILFSVLIILLSETLGLWFLNARLQIPAERMVAANWVFQFAIFSFVLTLLQTPFSSAVIAYEEMEVYSFVSLGECFLKLFFVILLAHIQADKLIMYALFLMIIPFISLSVYVIYVKIKYEKCKFVKSGIGLWHELLVFAGWTMFGSAASISITQVCTFLVNIFFGPIVNAARAIASQVSGILNSFTVNFLTAVRPPMIKAYADEQYDYLNVVFNYSNKLIYYGMLVLFIPLFLKMECVLSLWLDTTDPQTVLFCRLMLVYTFILAISNPITIVMHATGYVKQYHLLVEIPTLLIMPITYVLFKLGHPAESTYYTMIIAIIVSHLIRLVCLRRYYPSFDLANYMKSFLLRALVVTAICFLGMSYVSSRMPDNLWMLVVLGILSVFSVVAFSYLIGLDSGERTQLVAVVKRTLERKRNR